MLHTHSVKVNFGTVIIDTFFPVINFCDWCIVKDDDSYHIFVELHLQVPYLSSSD